MEEWIRWEPIKGLLGKYYIDSFGMSEEWDLVIQLSDHNNSKKIEIRFNGCIDAYRYTNDSFVFKVPSDLSKKYGDEFYANWSFFKITNSEYLQWLSEKSYEYSQDFPFRHFCIIGGDEIIDILARYEPEVKIIIF